MENGKGKEYYSKNGKLKYDGEYLDGKWNGKEKNIFKMYKCSKTDYYSGECAGCIEGYYLGYEDNKCSLIEGCALSENENIIF